MTISTDLRREEWLDVVKTAGAARAWPADLVEDLLDELGDLPWTELYTLDKELHTSGMKRSLRADTMKKAAQVVARVAPALPGANKLVTFFAQRATIEGDATAHDWEASLLGSLVDATKASAADASAAAQVVGEVTVAGTLAVVLAVGVRTWSRRH